MTIRLRAEKGPQSSKIGKPGQTRLATIPTEASQQPRNKGLRFDRKGTNIRPCSVGYERTKAMQTAPRVLRGNGGTYPFNKARAAMEEKKNTIAQTQLHCLGVSKTTVNTKCTKEQNISKKKKNVKCYAEYGYGTRTGRSW